MTGKNMMRRLKNVTQDLGIEILRDSKNRKITGRKKSNLRHECEKKNPQRKKGKTAYLEEWFNSCFT
jgi:hypothetical protein